MLLLTDLILEEFGDQVSPELRKYLARLGDQAEGILELITAFRYLTNIKGPNVSTEEFGLVETVEKLIADCFPEYPRDRIEIELPTSVVGYRVLIETLFRNLIENAKKYGTEDMVMSISGRMEGEQLSFVVGNTWHSNTETPEEYLRPFVRGEQTSSGFGIGLSICKRIVEIHGGRLWLEPDQQTFRVRFTLGETS